MVSKFSHVIRTFSLPPNPILVNSPLQLDCCPHHSTEAALVNTVIYMPPCCPNLQSLLYIYLTVLHSVDFSTSLTYLFSSLSPSFLGFKHHLSEDNPSVQISGPHLPLEFQTHISSCLCDMSKRMFNNHEILQTLDFPPLSYHPLLCLLILTQVKNLGIILNSSISLTFHIRSFNKPVSPPYKHMPNWLYFSPSEL